jgi:hypothetical protein
LRAKIDRAVIGVSRAMVEGSFNTHVLHTVEFKRWEPCASRLRVPWRPTAAGRHKI